MPTIQYIYHGVPASWTNGDTLYPLFDLKVRHPEIFEREIKKYDDHPGRKELPYKMIGKLNCPRGEVVHFSAVHPGRIFQALKTVFPDGNRSVQFFQIPIERVRSLPAALYDMNRGEYNFGEIEPEETIRLSILSVRTAMSLRFQQAFCSRQMRFSL